MRQERLLGSGILREPRAALPSEGTIPGQVMVGQGRLNVLQLSSCAERFVEGNPHFISVFPRHGQPRPAGNCQPERTRRDESDAAPAPLLLPTQYSASREDETPPSARSSDRTS